MLEKLAGRLRWERTGQGIRIVIPARQDWWIVPLAIFLTAIAWVDWTDWFFLHNSLPDSSFSKLAWLGIATSAVLACIFVCWFLWGMTGKTILAMDPFELKLERRVIGIEWDIRKFSTYDVKNLRYIPPAYIWAFRTDTDPTTSKIQFQAKSKTIRFARGITEREACLLFDKMDETYKFPRCSADPA